MAPGDDQRGDDTGPPARGDDPDDRVDYEEVANPRTRANETAGEDDEYAREEGGWRFSLDDVDEDGIVTTEIEPGDPDLENAAFVLLGAIAMVLVFFRLSLLLG